MWLVIVRVVWHGYHGDRSYKGLPAYGDQHGTAPRHSGVTVLCIAYRAVHSQSMTTYPANAKLRQATAFAASMALTREGLVEGFPKVLSRAQNHSTLI